MELKKTAAQMFLYLTVSVVATLIEWGLFYVFNRVAGVGYLISATAAYIISTFANWFFGKVMVFHENKGMLSELAKIYLTAIVGLLLNLIIMYVAVEWFSCDEMLSKILATVLVFAWNFAVRKFLIYKI